MSHSQEELLKLGQAVAQLGAGKTAEELESWVKGRSVQIKDEGAEGGATQHIQVSPRLPVFSGSDGKGEVSFTLWEYELSCLKAEGIGEVALMQAVRRSLRGEAADILLNLGNKATVDELVDKLEVVFGDICTSESILEQFFSAKQLNRESVAAWGCRLEQTLMHAKRKKVVGVRDTDTMLRAKFWSGLADSDIKMSLRHLYDQKSSFSDLLVRARALESEFSLRKVRVAQQVPDPVNAKLDELLSKFSAFESRLGELESRQSAVEDTLRQGRGSSRSCFGCGSVTHLVRDCPTRQGNGQGSSQEGQGWARRV